MSMQHTCKSRAEIRAKSSVKQYRSNYTTPLMVRLWDGECIPRPCQRGVIVVGGCIICGGEGAPGSCGWVVAYTRL